MIPSIDYSSKQDIFIQQLHDACKTYGCFYLYNHGISKQMIDNCYNESKKFFKLPIGEKNKILINKEKNRGYQPFNGEFTSGSTQKVGDYKEGFLFGKEHDANHPKSKLKFHGKNKWPDENILPHFKATLETYFSEIHNFGLKKLLPLIFKSLNISDNIIDELFEDPYIIMKIVHYSNQISDVDNGIFSCGAHKDFGIFTLLSADNNPGLQVYLNDNWIDIEPNENALFVNLGKTTELLTNGYCKSILHRVINKSGLERYSMPAFFDPDFSAKIYPLQQFITDKNNVYEPVIYGNKFDNDFGEIAFDNNS